MEATKIIQQDDSNSKWEKGTYLGENDSKVNSEIKEADNLESKSLSEAFIRPFKPLINSQQEIIPN